MNYGRFQLVMIREDRRGNLPWVREILSKMSLIIFKKLHKMLYLPDIYHLNISLTSQHIILRFISILGS